MEPLVPIEKLRASQGTMLTQGLFMEWHNQHGIENCPYTLKDYDHKGSKSMHAIYIQAPSEYEAAITLLGSWKHWNKLKKCTWFKPYYDTWESERQLRIDSIAERVLFEQAEDGSVTAAKAIVDKKKEKNRGRPSKQEKTKLAKEEQELEEFLNKTMAKVTFLNSVK